MAYEVTEIGQQMKKDAKGAAVALIALLSASGGNSVHAANAAGVNHSTLKRWITKLDPEFGIRESLEKIRKASEKKTLTDKQRDAIVKREMKRKRREHLVEVYRSLSKKEREKHFRNQEEMLETWCAGGKQPLATKKAIESDLETIAAAAAAPKKASPKKRAKESASRGQPT